MEIYRQAWTKLSSAGEAFVEAKSKFSDKFSSLKCRSQVKILVRGSVMLDGNLLRSILNSKEK